jgi:L-alanine-DL-glutamate epimerase-like enolase superfamily enzyme
VKIRRVEAIAVRLPLRRPVKMASEVVSAAENVLVRLETAEGIIGWGEAASAPTMTGETLGSMVRAVAEVSERLTDTDDAHAALHRTRSGAKAAIEIALLDAMGKAAGKPVHALLGGERRASVPLMWTPAGDVAEARERFAAGYRAFKIKVGIGDPAADAARTAAICAELRGAGLVCADANQGWTREQAIDYVRAVQPLGLAFLEQPVARGDMEGMAAVARASAVPIAFDEGVHDLDGIRRYHAAGCAGGSLKAIKLGGLRGIVAAAELCQSLELKVNLACKIAESGIAAAALLHAASAVPALDWAVSITSHNLQEDVIATPLAIADGRASVPRGPGLGVEVRQKEIRRYRI